MRQNVGCIHNHWAELEDGWAYGQSTQCQRRQCQSELRPRRPRRHHCQERNGGYCCKNCHARYITGSKPRGNKTNHTDTCKVYMHASCAAREALAQHFNMMYTTSGQPCGSALRRSSSDGWGQDHLRRAYKRMKPRVGRTQQFSFTTVPSAANVPSNGQRPTFPGGTLQAANVLSKKSCKAQIVQGTNLPRLRGVRARALAMAGHGKVRVVGTPRCQPRLLVQPPQTLVQSPERAALEVCVCHWLSTFGVASPLRG